MFSAFSISSRAEMKLEFESSKAKSKSKFRLNTEFHQLFLGNHLYDFSDPLTFDIAMMI